MTTIKELIDLLSTYPQDFVITDEQNRPFIHIVNGSDFVTLSTQKPIGICDRTSGCVYQSIIDDYKGFCPELDEDLYENEFTRIKDC